jgi:hypothetical protein
MKMAFDGAWFGPNSMTRSVSRLRFDVWWVRGGVGLLQIWPSSSFYRGALEMALMMNESQPNEKQKTGWESLGSRASSPAITILIQPSR